MRWAKRGQEHRAWNTVLDEDLRVAHQSHRKRTGISQALRFSHFYPGHFPDLRKLSCSDNLFLTCRKLAILSCTKHIWQVWLYFSPHSTSTHPSMERWNAVLPGPNLVKWGSKPMAQLCWNVVTDVFATALSQQVKEGGDALQRALATMSGKRRVE